MSKRTIGGSEDSKGTMSRASRNKLVFFLSLVIGLPILFLSVVGLFQYKQTEGLILSILGILLSGFFMMYSIACFKGGKKGKG